MVVVVEVIVLLVVVPIECVCATGCAVTGSGSEEIVAVDAFFYVRLLDTRDG